MYRLQRWVYRLCAPTRMRTGGVPETLLVYPHIDGDEEDLDSEELGCAMGLARDHPQ